MQVVLKIEFYTMNKVRMSGFFSFVSSAAIAGCTAFISKAFIDKEYYGCAFGAFFIGIHAAASVFTGKYQ